jgi:DNA repair exonuclease SbcCD ATPase subunit
MNRPLLAFAMFLITGLAISTMALAIPDDPPPANPAQPKAVQAQPKVVQVQPIQPGTIVTRVTPARMATLEEEFETLEAHRDVKKAYVRAAEVALKGAEASLELMNKPNVIPVTELMKAKLELESAKAQLDIRMAELKEVEVKVKHAKKRLDEAKAAPVRPAPKVDRKPVDPPPPPAFGLAADPVDPKAVEELKKKVAELEAVLADKQAAAKKAEVVAKEAKEELAKIVDIAMRGRVLPGTIEKAQAKADEAKAKAEKAAAEVKKSLDELEKAKAKLKEIE